jgi:chemotaxis-related protein WspB
MLFVAFRIGGDRYVLATDVIVEVLPGLQLKVLPGTPPGVAGLCNYRGRPVPVIDIGASAIGRPTELRWGTRLLLVRYPDNGPGHRLLGLLVEDATQVLRLLEDQFTHPGIRNDGAPYLGAVAATQDGLVQRVDLRSLLAPQLHELLFAAVEDAPA